MSFYRRPWGLYAFVLLLYAFLFLPILDVVVNSFNRNSSMVGWGGFTVGWYRTAWGNPVIRNGALNSVIIALASTVASGILGTAAAMALNRSRRITRAMIVGMTYARIVVPELVLALALLIFLTRIGLPLGIWSIVIGHTVFDSAYVTVVVQARLVGRDPAVDEAARDLGAPPRRVFRRVTLPDILPAIVAGCLLAFTFSLDDAVTSFFLSGSQNTLPLVILSLVRFQVTPTVNAIGTAMMAVTFLAMGAFLFVNFRWSNRSRCGGDMTAAADDARMDTPLVQLRGVSKGYGDVVAVNAVDLELRRGEFFSLLGPSGCGKTTTLRLIGGFEVPNSGEILIGGRDVARVPPHKRPVNTVFQSYALFQHLNVFNNIGFGLKESRRPKQEIATRVKRALELVSLTGTEQRMPRQLSGGQQQRVALARAVVNEPEVLLLDEPLGALDLKLRKEMQSELKHMQERLEITFLYVTHDQEEAFTMSDRVGVMNKGELVQVGSPEELYDRPRNRYVAGFVGEANILEGRVVSRDGQAAAVDAGSGGTLKAVLDEANPVHVGQDVYVVIRPERMEFDAGDSAQQPRGEQWSCLDGMLRETIFSGSRRTLIVEIAGGRRMSVSLPNRSEAAKSAELGSKVRLSWLTADAWLMAD